MSLEFEDGIPSNSFCFMPPEISPKNGKDRSFRRGASVVLQHLVRRDTAVGQWLYEIRRNTEAECLNSLHAKEIAETADLKQALAVRCAEVLIRKIRRASIELIDSLDDQIDKLPISIESAKEFKADVEIINRNVISVIDACRKRKNFDENVLQLASELISTCESIRIALGDFIVKNAVNNPILESHLRKIKELLGSMVDRRIKGECHIIFRGLYAPKEGLCLKWTLLALKSITNGDTYICRIFAENDSLIKKLIEFLTSHMAVPSLKSASMLRTTALRTLYFLCINPEAMRIIYRYLDLEKHITTVLDSERNDFVLREVAGLLVPLTTPFIDYTKTSGADKGLSKFVKNREDLVVSLLKVVTSTRSKELFLLVTWSLANISFYDPHIMVDTGVLPILMAKTQVRSTFGDDIAIKDQVLSILANVAEVNPLKTKDIGGLVYLKTAIQIRPVAALRDEAELEIIERIQKKVATALTRLAKNVSIAMEINRLKICYRLVQICKDSKERNSSDTVLVACLIAVRRICEALKNVSLEDMDAEDLVMLSFEKAFKTYSCRDESHV